MIDKNERMVTMKDNKIIITNFTDPVCTWCWGSEPVLRALETRYPGQIENRYVMGGLVEDINDFTDPSNGIEAGAEQANAQVAKHWVEAGKRHGMPVEPEGFHLFSDEYPSTYPQNIAYKAAQLVAPDKADQFLRRIREATIVEGLVTSRVDVQMSLADEVGIDIVAFSKAIKDGSAKKAFQGDLGLTRSLGVTGFPTFMVKFYDQRIMLRGYRDLDTFISVIDTATGGSIKPIQVSPNDDILLDLLDKHSNLAAEEIRQAFGLGNKAEVDSWMDQLEQEKKIIRINAGQSYFVKRTGRKNLTCDIDTGLCR